LLSVKYKNREIDRNTMKGAALPIETIVILALAVIVFGILLWFFASSSSPAIDLTIQKQNQATLCSSFHQRTDGCRQDKFTTEIDNNAGATDFSEDLNEVCFKLRDEGGYSSCGDATGGVTYDCAVQCCEMFCGETA
jgi:hypothetical protein